MTNLSKQAFLALPNAEKLRYMRAAGVFSTHPENATPSRPFQAAVKRLSGRDYGFAEGGGFTLFLSPKIAPNFEQGSAVFVSKAQLTDKGWKALEVNAFPNAAAEAFAGTLRPVSIREHFASELGSEFAQFKQELQECLNKRGFIPESLYYASPYTVSDRHSVCIAHIEYAADEPTRWVLKPHAIAHDKYGNPTRYKANVYIVTKITFVRNEASVDVEYNAFSSRFRATRYGVETFTLHYQGGLAVTPIAEMEFTPYRQFARRGGAHAALEIPIEYPLPPYTTTTVLLATDKVVFSVQWREGWEDEPSPWSRREETLSGVDVKEVILEMSLYDALRCGTAAVKAAAQQAEAGAQGLLYTANVRDAADYAQGDAFAFWQWCVGANITREKLSIDDINAISKALMARASVSAMEVYFYLPNWAGEAGNAPTLLHVTPRGMEIVGNTWKKS